MVAPQPVEDELLKVSDVPGVRTPDDERSKPSSQRLNNAI